MNVTKRACDIGPRLPVLTGMRTQDEGVLRKRFTEGGEEPLERLEQGALVAGKTRRELACGADPGCPQLRLGPGPGGFPEHVEAVEEAVHHREVGIDHHELAESAVNVVYFRLIVSPQFPAQQINSRIAGRMNRCS